MLDPHAADLQRGTGETVRVKVVGFYTLGNGYEAEAAKLRASLQELAVPHTLKPFKFDGPDVWKRAVMHKPRFILDQLIALETTFDGLIYTDADSILRRPMPLEQLDGCDVGYCQFRWSPSHTWECLTGTVYFARDPRVASFISAWASHTIKWAASDTPEQFALCDTLREWDQKIVAKKLSSEWCSIHDAPRETGHRPIFEHYQASRRLKR